MTTTIEELRELSKLWIPDTSVALKAAAELEALQRINDQNAHDFKQLRDALKCDGSDLPQLLSAVEALQKEVDNLSNELALRIGDKLEITSLRAQLTDVRQHSAQSDKELCQLQDALGCPCESRKYFCDCGWRGYNQHKCPKCGKETHDDGMADAQELCMERIRDFVMAEDENKTLRAQNQTLREACRLSAIALKEYDLLVANGDFYFNCKCHKSGPAQRAIEQAIAQSPEGKS